MFFLFSKHRKHIMQNNPINYKIGGQNYSIVDFSPKKNTFVQSISYCWGPNSHRLAMSAKLHKIIHLFRRLVIAGKDICPN